MCVGGELKYKGMISLCSYHFRSHNQKKWKKRKKERKKEQERKGK